VLVVFVNLGSAPDQHVGVAVGVGFAAYERLAGAGRIAQSRMLSRSIVRSLTSRGRRRLCQSAQVGTERAAGRLGARRPQARGASLPRAPRPAHPRRARLRHSTRDEDNAAAT